MTTEELNPAPDHLRCEHALSPTLRCIGLKNTKHSHVMVHGSSAPDRHVDASE